jgi:hypothetical protein
MGRAPFRAPSLVRQQGQPQPQPQPQPQAAKKPLPAGAVPRAPGLRAPAKPLLACLSVKRPAATSAGPSSALPAVLKRRKLEGAAAASGGGSTAPMQAAATSSAAPAPPEAAAGVSRDLPAAPQPSPPPPPHQQQQQKEQQQLKEQQERSPEHAAIAAATPAEAAAAHATVELQHAAPTTCMVRMGARGTTHACGVRTPVTALAKIHRQSGAQLPLHCLLSECSVDCRPHRSAGVGGPTAGPRARGPATAVRPGPTP